MKLAVGESDFPHHAEHVLALVRGEGIAHRDDELTALLDGYQASQEIVSDAWAAFETNGDVARLEAEIARSIEQMKLLRERT